MTEIIYNEKREALEEFASKKIAESIQSVLQRKDKAVLAVPGGRSVEGIFHNLLKEDIPWEKTHIFMVDERLVSINDEDSNFRLAKDSFIDRLEKRGSLPMSNIHPFIIDESNDDNGIGDYTEELKSVGGRYDIVLLSSGEDGHIGALYPNHHSIEDEGNYYIQMTDSPKPPKRRMSASRNLLLESKYGILMFLGSAKKDALKKFLDKSSDIKSCPAKIVNEMHESYALTDIKIV